MKIRRAFAILGKIMGYTVAAALILATLGCDPALETFHVTKVDLTPPNWVPSSDYTYKVVVAITFDRAVDEDSVSAPATLKIDIEGTRDGRIESNVAGTIQLSSDYKTMVFISDQSLTDLINPQAGENIKYTITLIGTGTITVTDTNGEILDGDKDGVPGGDFSEVIEVIG